MILEEIQSGIEAIKDNKALFKDRNFAERAEAIDHIDFHIIGHIDHLLGEKEQPEELLVLKQEALDIKGCLEQIDLDLFLRLRTGIQSGTLLGKAFKDEIRRYVTISPDIEACDEEAGYDTLDLLINGIFPMQDVPAETKEREPEMVFYQKTPARVIFELAEKVHFSEKDVFYDLGSGLGHVPILVNLLTGVRSVGVEFEPSFCQYARDCAAGLNVKNVEFINDDARGANYSEGTVFFMYTPFTGRVLQEVLDILKEESEKRMIRIFTYGPCTLEVARQNWLIPVNHSGNDIYKLGEFILTGLPQGKAGFTN